MMNNVFDFNSQARLLFMPPSRIRRILRIVRQVWITVGILFFVVFTTWALLAYRASARAYDALETDERVKITDHETHWSFLPGGQDWNRAGLAFFPGAAVDPAAYAVLCRRVAEAGYPVVLVKVPRRGMFGGAEGPVPFARARAGMRELSTRGWVVAGHSRGARIAAEMLLHDPSGIAGLILIGSSHPRDFSIAHVTGPVTRIYGTRDTVADVEKLEATRRNLPASARWVRVDGGNHSQFGHYGFQPGDWPATISREEQQAQTLAAILHALR
jgi:pimeloyl-ACP methyl ester carboxylesterase